jgi:ribosomal protein S12 methylthiotransferase
MRGLERLRFTHLGIFIYSQEEGTDAAQMEDQVGWEIKKERAERVLDLAQKLQAEETERLKATNQEAVVDFIAEYPEGDVTGGCVTGVTGVTGTGRLWSDAPEIDRVVKIQGEGLQAGGFEKVEITGGKDDCIFARWIKPR